MGKKEYVSKLSEYASRTRLEVKYEDVVSDRPGHNKKFFKRAVVNGEGFPIGEGRNKREARQNAAKNALRVLSDKENQGPVAEKAAKNPTAPVHPKCATKLNFGSSDYGQQKRAPLQLVGSTRLRLNNAAPLVAGDKEHPAASGKTKREAKEEATGLVYQEVPFGSALPDDGAPARRSTSPNTLESTDAVSKSVPSTTSDPVLLIDSSEDQSDVKHKRGSHRNINGDVMIPEENNIGNSPSDKTSIQSEIVSKFTAEFDSIECLGKGAFGHVYKAGKKKWPKRYYAIKMVTYKEKRKKEAEKEVEVLSDLHHDNIIRYYTSWMENSSYQWDSTDDSCSNSQSTDNSSEKFLYIQMELCDKTLRVWIDERNTQNVRDSKRREDSRTIALQIVSGVEYIHSNKLIHRDLKPANIMFGQDKKVKIGDFGLVTDENDDDAENPIDRTAYKGTPSYMAPEQKCETTYNRKVDIFPIGLMFFELLWRIGTVHEREGVWGNARRQKLPQGFSHSFFEECIIIKPMLCENPEGRPEASKLKADLEEITRRLNKKEIIRRGNRTV